MRAVLRSAKVLAATLVQQSHGQWAAIIRPSAQLQEACSLRGTARHTADYAFLRACMAISERLWQSM